MADKNVNIRLVATGGGQLRAELVEVGQAGDAAFAKVKASADSASVGIKRAGDAAKSVGQATAGMGGGMRNTMQQLSQLGQSTAATGNFLQSFAVQLPDLALGLGPVGMAIGTVTGLLLSMAPSLLGTGDAAKEYKNRLKEAEDASRALKDAVTEAAIPLYELKKLYGESADEVARLNRNQLAAARGAAAKELQDVVSALGLSQGSFARNMQGPQKPGMFSWLTAGASAEYSELDATLAKIATKYGLVSAQAERVTWALERVSRAKTPDEVITAADRLQATLIEVAGSAEAAAVKFPDLWEKSKDAANLAKQNVEAVTEATGKMVAGFDAGITKLEQLRRGMESWGASGVLDRVGGWLTGLRDQTLPQYGAASKGILDLIGWAEGTDKGRGYNETLGYGAYTGGPVNLINMRLNEVLALQKRMLAHPDNHYNSSAVGRYQIVSTTLRRLMGQMGLTGEELFDKSMQDRMAMELVRERSRQGTKAGWDAEWQSFKTKNVSLATINAALGQQGIGVDPGIAAEQKRQNDQLQRGLDLRADFIGSLKDQADAAALEAQVTGKSVYEQVRLRTEMTLTQQARAKGIDLAEKIGDSERTYGQAIRETADQMARAAQEQAAREAGVDAAAKAAEKAAAAMKRVQDDLRQGFHSAFDSVIQGTKSVGEAIADMLANIALQWAHSKLDELLNMAFTAFGGGDALGAALAGAGVPPPTAAASPFGGALGMASQAVRVMVGIDPANGNVTGYVDKRAAVVSSRQMTLADRQMPARVKEITRDPLKVS